MNIRFSPLLATGVRTIVPTLTLFALYLLVVGHDVPGGGFAGGLIASSALLLMYLAFGSHGLRRMLPTGPERILGIGLALAVIAGLIGLFAEGTFLTYTYASFEAALLGEVKLSTLLVFDLGVFILVIGLVSTAILGLGSEET